ncbi:SOS response-associated peptidase family protein [Candidatus Saccharibacteria bacterium]|nr:SOS response-associated peptidase family protein [Candidatus Saccharibacteria bacterium]
MCGRYTFFSTKDIVDQYNLIPKEKAQLEIFQDNYNVTPGSEMPVIIRGEQQHHLKFMIWGLLPAWSKTEESGLKLINARVEGLFEKPM